MSRYHSYLDTASKLLEQYRGKEPFAAFLKKYFAQHKKHGSRDRKQITHLCYCYFRTAHVLKGRPLQDQLQQALFLCSQTPVSLLDELHPEWSSSFSLSTEDKLAVLELPDTAGDFFPWATQLTEELDKSAFSRSFLVQPDTFIRIRPGHAEQLEKKLIGKGIVFSRIRTDCFSFPAGTKLDELLLTNKEAVIQDYSSQQVGELLEQVKPDRQGGSVTVWDCCAASGGKSIMAKDRLGPLALTVSDIRESILHNLKKRFAEAGMGSYKQVVADLTKEDPFGTQDYFDLVIADVPCSGSGTWSRTPEQLSYFSEPAIGVFSQLQKNIVSTAVTHVKSGGYFLYITCSVFKAENEDVAAFIEKEKGLTLIKKELIAGYTVKADTMFACLFRK